MTRSQRRAARRTWHNPRDPRTPKPTWWELQQAKQLEEAAYSVPEDRLYFAYGSNLDVIQMYRRCKTAIAVRRFTIKGWKLVFRSVADIVKSEGSAVHGALYRVTAGDVAALDRYEGVKSGLYRQVTFRISGTDELGFFYVMNDDFICPPSRDYFETIVNGYRDWDIPYDTLDAAYDESFEWIDAEEIVSTDLDQAYHATMGSPNGWLDMDDWDTFPRTDAHHLSS